MTFSLCLIFLIYHVFALKLRFFMRNMLIFNKNVQGAAPPDPSRFSFGDASRHLTRKIPLSPTISKILATWLLHLFFISNST